MTDKETKQKCENCRFWGNGDGTGLPYDAGHVNYCKQPQIDGIQHPSFGACGDLKTMLYVEGFDSKGRMRGGEHQNIMTRYSFGCNLFHPRTQPRTKDREK